MPNLTPLNNSWSINCIVHFMEVWFGCYFIANSFGLRAIFLYTISIFNIYYPTDEKGLYRILVSHSELFTLYGLMN